MGTQEKGDRPMTTDITDAIIEGEEVPSASASLATRASAPAPMTLFGSTDPKEVITAATKTAEALCEILEEQTLYKDIRDRRHVLVEGWTLLGSMLGVFPTTTWTRKVTDDQGRWQPPQVTSGERKLHSKWCKNGADGHRQTDGCDTYTRDVREVTAPGIGGWEARVEAHTLSGDIVGAAEAECRWDEYSWRDRDSHALRSMAQTRATAKALRMPLGFIVELAGFAATPAEEMTGVEAEAEAGTESGSTYRCPSCNGPLWDNRADNVDRLERGEKAWPAFKCKNTSCTGSDDGQPWVTWDTHHFADSVTKAKHQLVKLVRQHRAAWDIYFPPGDPSYDEETSHLVSSAHDDPDDIVSRAGLMWREFDKAGLLGDPPTELELRILIKAAEIALQAVGNDADDIRPAQQAWDDAEAALADAEAGESAHLPYG